MSQILSALLGMLFVGMLTGSVMLWWWAFRCLRGGVPLLKFEPRRPVPWSLIDLTFIFVIVLVVLVGGQSMALRFYGLSSGVEVENATAQHLSVSIFSSSIGLLVGCVLAILLLKVRGASWRDLGLAARRLWDDIRIGVAAFVMLAPPMYFMQFLLTRLWPSEHPLQTMLLEDPQWSIILGATFTAVLVAPLTEEIFFRLIFQGWMEKASTLVRKLDRGADAIGIPGAQQAHGDVISVFLGDSAARRIAGVEAPFHSAAPVIAKVPDNVEEEFPQAEPAELTVDPAAAENPYVSPQSETAWTEKPTAEAVETPANPLPQAWPIVVSAAVFALLHWGHGPDPIPLFFLAAGLGYLYQRTHRIVPCIVVHFLVNSLSMVALIAFSLSGQDPPE